MARKKRGGDGGGEGANWMDTYGDLVTLLLCFFVLLYSFSSVDAAKWSSLVFAFTGVGPGDSAIPAMDINTVVEAPIALEIDSSMANTPNDPSDPAKGNGTQDLENFYALVDGLNEFIKNNSLNAELFEDAETLTVTVRLNDNIFFDSGDATLKQESYPILDNLAQLLADSMHIINTLNIEGHTDTDPIRTSQYEDNRDLSSKRANNAARYITSANEAVEQAKVIATGMSEYHPVAPNDTPEGKAKNRRIDFVFQSVVTGN